MASRIFDIQARGTPVEGAPRRSRFRWLRFAVGAASLGYLVASGRLRWEHFRPATEHAGPFLAGAVVLMVLVALFQALRYRVLLGGLGIGVRVRDAVALSLLGQYFNTCLAGGVAGEVVRMGYVASASGERAKSVAATLMDRALGLLAMLLCAGAALLFGTAGAGAQPVLARVSLLVFAGVGGAVLCGVVSMVALTRGRRTALAAWIVTTASLGVAEWCVFERPGIAFAAAAGTAVVGRALGCRAVVALASACALGCAMLLPGCRPGGRVGVFVKERVPLGRKLMGLVEAVLAYRDRPGSLGAAFGLSLLLQVLNLLGVFCFAGALDVPTPELAQILVTAPVAFLACSVPVLGGAAGVGALAFDHLLAACGCPGGAAVFLVWRCWTVVVGLLGLLVYLGGWRLRVTVVARGQSSLTMMSGFSPSFSGEPVPSGASASPAMRSPGANRSGPPSSTSNRFAS